MSKYSLYTLICASLMALVLCSCQISNASDQEGISREPQELGTCYPSDITRVDSIQIMSGSDGTKKTTTDQAIIQEWIDKVRHLKIVLDPNQEDSTGVLFHVTLFEQGNEMLYMTPASMNHQRMEPHSELADRMTELYDAIK